MMTKTKTSPEEFPGGHRWHMADAPRDGSLIVLHDESGLAHRQNMPGYAKSQWAFWFGGCFRLLDAGLPAGYIDVGDIASDLVGYTWSPAFPRVVVQIDPADPCWKSFGFASHLSEGQLSYGVSA